MCGCRLWTELCTLSTAGCTGHKINIPRQSRGFFICGHSPRILARASRRASTVCQPRKFRYLPPVNGHFRSLAWSAALLLCPARTDIGCTPVSSLHFFLLCPRGTLSTRIPDFGICISVPETSRKHQAALSFQDPHEPRYAIFGGISISMWMWSGHISASMLLIPFQLHSALRMLPISLLFSPKNTFRLYFEANTTHL